jgi:hypothetical protein
MLGAVRLNFLAIAKAPILEVALAAPDSASMNWPWERPARATEVSVALEIERKFLVDNDNWRTPSAEACEFEMD